MQNLVAIYESIPMSTRIRKLYYVGA